MRGRPFSISIDEFIKTGCFGNVKPGMMMDEVKRIFPKPDSVNCMNRKGDTYIWLYDYLEFHFFDKELMLIWCDYLGNLRSPDKKQFKLDRGFLNAPTDITTVTRQLKRWNKQIKVIGYCPDGNLESVIYVFDSMEFFFEGDEDIPVNQWELNGIGSLSLNFSHNYTSSFYKKLDLIDLG